MSDMHLHLSGIFMAVAAIRTGYIDLALWFPFSFISHSFATVLLNQSLEFWQINQMLISFKLAYSLVRVTTLFLKLFQNDYTC